MTRALHSRRLCVQLTRCCVQTMGQFKTLDGVIFRDNVYNFYNSLGHARSTSATRTATVSNAMSVALNFEDVLAFERVPIQQARCDVTSASPGGSPVAWAVEPPAWHKVTVSFAAAASASVTCSVDQSTHRQAAH